MALLPNPEICSVMSPGVIAGEVYVASYSASDTSKSIGSAGSKVRTTRLLSTVEILCRCPSCSGAWSKLEALPFTQYKVTDPFPSVGSLPPRTKGAMLIHFREMAQHAQGRGQRTFSVKCQIVFRACGPYSLCHIDSTLSLSHESIHRRYIKTMSTAAFQQSEVQSRCRPAFAPLAVASRPLP